MGQKKSTGDRDVHPLDPDGSRRRPRRNWPARGLSRFAGFKLCHRRRLRDRRRLYALVARPGEAWLRRSAVSEPGIHHVKALRRHFRVVEHGEMHALKTKTRIANVYWRKLASIPLSPRPSF